VVDRSPRPDSRGHIDNREHGDIAVVQAGVVLMRRIPAVSGQDGITVRGRILSARKGLDTAFSRKIKGAEISQDDPEQLVAAVAGQPVLSRDGVDVESVLRLREEPRRCGLPKAPRWSPAVACSGMTTGSCSAHRTEAIRWWCSRHSGMRSPGSMRVRSGCLVVAGGAGAV
jgi:hypothetical protein